MKYVPGDQAEIFKAVTLLLVRVSVRSLPCISHKRIVLPSSVFMYITSRAGLGYTSTSSVTRSGTGHSVVGVALSTITGSGRNAVATVLYNIGSVVSATITNGGAGYSVGDVLGITTSLGINARLTVASIGSTSELILDLSLIHI